MTIAYIGGTEKNKFRFLVFTMSIKTLNWGHEWILFRNNGQSPADIDKVIIDKNNVGLNLLVPKFQFPNGPDLKK